MPYGKKKYPSREDKILSASELRRKGAAYCAYRERTQQEVRDKLYSLGAHSEEVEETVTWLITENFINEERYARAYAGGKFRLKGWGRIKIRQGLKMSGLSTYCIQQGMNEIEEEEYEKKLRSLMERKYRLEKETHTVKKKYKVARYAIGKGYEAELVWDILNRMG